MMTIREYKRVESLEEAWELNQKKANRVIGGMIWLKMSRGNVGTAIDISGLGLDQIEETEDAFEIGAMVTLRQLEEHPGLAAYTDGAMRESVRHIVGVQLSGEQIPVGILAADPMLTDTKLIYYGFPYEEIYPVGQVPDVRNLAECRDEFQYDMRRFLKGDEDTLHQALRRMRCNPVQNGVINYITSYEGFSLADLVSYDRKHNEANGEDNQDGNPYNASWNCGVEGPTRERTILQLRKRQMKNALALLLFSQGTPMLTAGDEL